MRAFLILSAALASLSSAEAQTGRRARDCDGVFRTRGLSQVEIQGTTPRNSVCEIIHHSSRNNAIVGYRVLSRPSHGILGSADGTGKPGGTYLTAYKPDDNFVGTDVFEIEIRYRRDGAEHPTHIRITLNVVDRRGRR